jgi:DNA-directed RNA polymerase alpha subunit
MKFGKRNADIYIMRNKHNLSLRKIGRDFDLSGEQVRLICNRIDHFLKTPEINFLLTGEGFKGKYVGELGFSKRTLNALEKAEIYTIEELKQKSYNDIVNMKGVGQVGAQEIFNKVLEVIKYEER